MIEFLFVTDLKGQYESTIRDIYLSKHAKQIALTHLSPKLLC